MGFNACDVVYDTSEEASTWRQAKAAERNTRARAWRGAVAQAISRGDKQRLSGCDLPIAERSVMVAALTELLRHRCPP